MGSSGVVPLGVVLLFLAQGFRNDVSWVLADEPLDAGQPGGCRPLKTDLCQGLGYTRVSFPNSLGHKNEEEALAALRNTEVWARGACNADQSKSFRFFVCVLYLPSCTVLEMPVPPCAPVCEEAQRSCGVSMRSRNVQWQQEWACEKFPPSGLCVESPGSSSGEPKSSSSSSSSRGSNSRSSSSSNGRGTDGACQRINRPGLCANLRYNMAKVPNNLGHRSTDLAALELNQFTPMFKVNCSPQLEPFLCAMYYPRCDLPGLVPPCRSLCLKAQKGCLPLMVKFGFSWPEPFSCDKFPETGNCLLEDDIIRTPGEVEEAPSPPVIANAGPNNRRPSRGPGGRPSRGPGGRPKGGHGLVSRCVPFQTDLCPDLPYNAAGFPNLLGHKSPEQAITQFNALTPLIKTGCSPRLRDFLCGVFLPQCKEKTIVAPCRSLCQESHMACAKTLLELHFRWPPVLNCDAFPKEGDGECFKGHDAVEKPTTKSVEIPEPEPSEDKDTAVAPTPQSGEADEKQPTGDLGPISPEVIMGPVMDWLASSAKLNREKSTLVVEQVKVARLTEEKLGLEIDQLKRETE